MTKKLNIQFGEDRHYEKVRGEEFDEKIHWQMYIVKYKLLFFKQYTHTRRFYWSTVVITDTQEKESTTFVVEFSTNSMYILRKRKFGGSVAYPGSNGFSDLNITITGST